MAPTAVAMAIRRAILFRLSVSALWLEDVEREVGLCFGFGEGVFVSLLRCSVLLMLSGMVVLSTGILTDETNNLKWVIGEATFSKARRRPAKV
jgi:hypothetical protein